MIDIIGHIHGYMNPLLPTHAKCPECSNPISGQVANHFFDIRLEAWCRKCRRIVFLHEREACVPRDDADS